MPEPPSDIAFTPAVKAVQERLGSRLKYSIMERDEGWSSVITPFLAEFIAARDTFFLATASAAGQPYVQHRGGPAGFLKVLDERTLAFADFGGNRQYITFGNLSENPRAFIFLLDYANRRRIKLWGSADVVEDDPALLQQLSDAAYRGRPERVIRFHIAAWDINCQAHIQRRFTEDEVVALIAPLQRRIDELEAQLAARSR